MSILMTTTVFAMFAAVPMSVSAGNTHNPIGIYDDSYFTDPEANTTYGVTWGNGTESNPYIISGWDIDASSQTGIDIEYTTVYFIVRNCNITGGASQTAIDFYQNDHARIEGCIISGIYYGVYSQQSRVEVLNNTISTGPNGFGIYSDHDTDFLARGNNISDCSDFGIYVYRSEIASCVDNEVELCYYGIYFNGGGSGIAAILGNNISDCTQSAIYSSQSQNVQIKGNNITNCGSFGIGLESCANGVVFHNNVNTSMGADYYSSTDQWDNGYPSGGNYWVQTTHVDDFSGVNQDIAGADGINDNPMIIDSDTGDRYPLFNWFSGNVEPAAGFNVSKRILNTTTALYMNASISVDTEDPLSALQFRWDYEGDMSWDTGFSSATDTTHTYAVEGNYTVRLEVMDSGGLTAIGTKDIIVSNKAHAPIVIAGDSEFMNSNSTTGVTWGNGTEADPYIISDWIFDASEGTGIYIHDTAAHFIIRGCQVYFGWPYFTGMSFYSVQNGKIENSVSMFNYFGMELYFGNNFEMTGCEIMHNFAMGIYFYSSNNTFISGCNASYNGEFSGDSGIYMVYTDNSLVYNCTANNCTNSGVYLDNCFNITVLRNNLSYCENYGAYAYSSQQINVVRNEMVDDSYGVYAGNCGNVNIVGNNFTGVSGSNGIDLESSTSVMVHHNNFFNLGTYAYDQGTSIWDAGYPVGGNYWDTWTSPDAASGPNQDLPGSDGIVDAPFVIDANSQDNYPLTAPFDMSNLPPIAVIAASARMMNTSTVLNVNASASWDLEDPTSALTVRWDWENDGTWDTSWSTTKNASHTYPVEGIYTIKVEVNDTAGLVTSSTVRAVVYDMYRATNIHINGNAQFDVAHGVNGGGDGSAINPYVIQNYALDATYSHGIWIENTNAHFLIQNVLVFYGESIGNDGINLEDLQNGTIMYSSFTDDYYGVRIYNSGNLSISDCMFESCYRSIEAYSSDFIDVTHIASVNSTHDALSIESYCDFIAIDDCYISGTLGTGIMIGNYNHDIQITNNKMDSVYRGFYGGYLSNVMIANNNMTATYQGITVYYSGDLRISGNEIFGPSYGMYLYDVEYSLIDYNYINTTTSYTVRMYYSQYVIFDNCYYNNGNSNGIRIQSSQYIMISNCTAENVYYGARGDQSSNISFRSNNFSGANTYGVYAYYLNWFEVIGNNLSHANYGVYASYSTNMYIEENAMYDNTGYGLYVSQGTSGIVKHNVVDNSGNYGIMMDTNAEFNITENNLSHSSTGLYVSYSNNLSIDENSMWNNTGDGLYFYSCTDTIVKHNIVGGSGYCGIRLEVSTGFLISGNDLIDNAIQAADNTGPQNRWNETALYGGGNYWSNYTYPDSNLDGFGDTPANITLDAVDYLPLAAPWVANQDPVANFTVTPSVGTLATPFSFDASGCMDVEDLTADLEVRWDWNNDGIFDTSWTTTKTASYTYSSPGAKTIKLEVRDTGGHSDTITKAVTVNEVAPVTTIALTGTLGANGWYTSNVQVNLTATDDYSGVNWTRYKIDAASWATFTVNLTMSNDGSFVLTFRSEDLAGLTETNKTTTVKIDKAAPTLTLNQTSGMTVTKDYAVISWIGSDETSGIDHFEVRIDGGSFSTVGTTMSYNFTSLTEGSHNVTVKAVDKAGLEFDTTLQFTVDIQAGGGGGISGDMLTYLLIIIIIIIIVIVIIAVLMMRRGKKPAVIEGPKPGSPVPPVN